MAGWPWRIDPGRNAQPTVVTNKLTRAIRGERATLCWRSLATTRHAAAAVIADEARGAVSIAFTKAKLFAGAIVAAIAAGRTVIIRRTAPTNDDIRPSVICAAPLIAVVVVTIVKVEVTASEARGKESKDGNKEGVEIVWLGHAPAMSKGYAIASVTRKRVDVPQQERDQRAILNSW